MSDRLQAEARPTNCPFCGRDDLEEWQTEMLHEAHEQIELMILADRDSDEFRRHFNAVAAFVGLESELPRD